MLWTSFMGIHLVTVHGMRLVSVQNLQPERHSPLPLRRHHLGSIIGVCPKSCFDVMPVGLCMPCPSIPGSTSSHSITTAFVGLGSRDMGVSSRFPMSKISAKKFLIDRCVAGIQQQMTPTTDSTSDHIHSPAISTIGSVRCAAGSTSVARMIEQMMTLHE